MKLNLSVLQQILVAVVLVGFSTSSPAVTVAVAVAVTGEDNIGSVRGGAAAIADEDGDNQRRAKGAKTSPSGVLVSGTGGADGTTNTRSEAEIVLEKKKTTATTSTRKFIQRSVIGIKRIKCSSFSWNKKKCKQKGDGACKFKESKNKCKTACGKITGKDPTQCENVKGCKLNDNGKCKKKKKKRRTLTPTMAPTDDERCVFPDCDVFPDCFQCKTATPSNNPSSKPSPRRTLTPTITPTIDEDCYFPNRDNCDFFPDCFQCRTATPSNNPSSKPSPTPTLNE